MADWSLDINKYANGCLLKVKEVKRKYAFGLYAGIVKKTPVDTGRARANWNISVGEVDPSVSDDTKKRGLKYKEEDIKLKDDDESIFISNNVEYITALEYGGYPSPVKKGTYNKKKKTYEIRSEGGYSKQAPNGMVGVTVANSKKYFNAAVRAVKGGSND